MQEAKSLRYAMIGGGIGGGIGGAHRSAVDLCGLADLVAGCFSRNKKKNKESGELLNIPQENVYDNYEDLARDAQKLKLDFVVVVTRPVSHYSICRCFLEAGVAVSCDKPVTATLEEALALQALAKEKNLDFMVTYTYTGYPMVIEARERILNGDLGEIRLASVQYQQDWMPRRFLPAEDKSVFWRTQASEGGPSCCVGDIGVHAEHMVSFLTQKPAQKVIATLKNFTEGHSLDDNAFILAQHAGNLNVSYWCSQVNVGRQNKLSFEIVGDNASLYWTHTAPDVLQFFKLGEKEEVLTKDSKNLSQASINRTLSNVENVECTHEAFGGLYLAFCRTLLSRREGKEPDTFDFFPTIEDGVRGMFFVKACLASNAQEQAWVEV